MPHQPRPKNPRLLLLQRVRQMNRNTQHVVRLITIRASRTVYITREERDELGLEPGTWNRSRRPDEHIDNRPQDWLEIRRALIDISADLKAADTLARYKLAELGYDARGAQIGTEEALGRLSADDKVVLELWGVIL